MRLSCLHLLPLFLSACSASPATDKTPPSALGSKAETSSNIPWGPCLALPVSATRLRCIDNRLPPVGAASPETAESIGAPELIESDDGHYPPTTYVFRHLGIDYCPCRGDDAIPWRTSIYMFDANRQYSAFQQNAIVQSEKALLNATEMRVPDAMNFGKTITELGVTVHPSALNSNPNNNVPSVPDEPSEFSAEPAGSAPIASGNSSNSFHLTNNDRRGNERFRAWFDSDTTLRAEANRNIFSNRRVDFNVQIFGSARRVARFDMNAQMNCASSSSNGTVSPRATAEIFAMGQRVLGLRTNPSGNWTSLGRFPPPGVFQIGSRYQRPRLVHQNRTFFRATARFMVGPIPMSVRAGVHGEIGLEMEGELNCEGMRLDAFPWADLRVVTEFAVNAGVIRVGLEGNLSLLRVDLPVQSSVRWLNADRCANWEASSSRLLTTLGGSINLFTVVRFLWFQQRHDLEIARWTGIPLNESERRQSGQFCP
jgi:hypothetical protein